MNPYGLLAKPLKNGRWKVYVWGTTNDHFMDWCGENARIRVAPDQPYSGWLTIGEARSYACQRFPDMNVLRDWGYKQRDGASMPNDAWKDAVDIDTPAGELPPKKERKRLKSRGLS